MTRDEAVRKIETSSNKDFKAIDAQCFVDGLEALGLIKFDKSKLYCDLPHFLYVRHCIAIEDLKYYGYKIVKDANHVDDLDFCHPNINP